MTSPARLLSLAVVASFAVLTGCSGKTIGDDLNSKVDPTTPADAGPDAPPVTCNDRGSACDPGDQAVPNEAACGSADYCYSRAGTCGVPPLWCAHYNGVQCGAIPTCDQGDTQVSGCPGAPDGSGFSCYSRTLCGSTIQCVHREMCKTLPTCDPGDKEVVDVSTCSQPGAKCYSRTACNFTIHCYSP